MMINLVIKMLLKIITMIILIISPMIMVIIRGVVLMIRDHPNGRRMFGSGGGFHKLNYSDRRRFWLNVIWPNLPRTAGHFGIFRTKAAIPAIWSEKRRKWNTWLIWRQVLNLYQGWSSEWWITAARLEETEVFQNPPFQICHMAFRRWGLLWKHKWQ